MFIDECISGDPILDDSRGVERSSPVEEKLNGAGGSRPWKRWGVLVALVNLAK
jgi:hypothetical protein